MPHEPPIFSKLLTVSIVVGVCGAGGGGGGRGGNIIWIGLRLPASPICNVVRCKIDRGQCSPTVKMPIKLLCVFF